MLLTLRLEVHAGLADALEREAHVIVVHGVACHTLVDLGELVAAVAERVASYGRVVEEVFDDDLGAVRGGRARSYLAVQLALLVGGRVGALRLRRARVDAQTRYVSDGGERLAAEAERVDSLQVVEGAQLGGGEALAHDAQVVFVDAAAVVLDLDELETAGLDLDGHVGGARVQTILDQLLERIERSLYDLSGRNAVHKLRIECTDAASWRLL